MKKACVIALFMNTCFSLGIEGFAEARPRTWLIHCLAVTVIVTGVFLAFGNALWFDFVWDDNALIVANVDSLKASTWFDVFCRSFWQLGENLQDPGRSFYRPLITLSYKLDCRLWGIYPFGYHLTNLVLHALCAIVVYVLANRLLGGAFPAFVSSLLWSVHPSHVENVAWISGRTDLFCGLFYLLALTCFLSWLYSTGRGRLSLFLLTIFYMLGLLSKEMALSLPLIMIGMFWISHGRRRHGVREFCRLLALLLALTLAYLLVRQVSLGKVMARPVFGSFYEYLLSLPMVFARYLGLLLSVFPADPHHCEGLVTTPFSWSFAAYLSVCILYLACPVMLYLRYGAGLPVFFLLWVPVTLLPVFYLGGFGDVLYADRFLYIPSVGLFCLFPLLVRLSAFGRYSGSMRGRALACVACIGIAGVSAYASRQYSECWENDISLFTTAAVTSPESAYIYYNKGVSLSRAGAIEDGLECYEKAIEIEPRYWQAYVNMAASFNKLARHDEALGYLGAALIIQDRNDLLFSSMGESYRALMMLDRAAQCYRLSLSIRETARYHNNLGECLILLENLDEAETHLRKSLEMDESPGVYNNLGLLFIERGQPAVALGFLEKATGSIQKKIPRGLNIAISANRARALAALGRTEEARLHARRAMALIPSDYVPQEYEVERLTMIKSLAFGGGDGTGSE